MKEPIVKKPVDLEHSHTPMAIRERIKEGHQHSYLKDFVYGSIDGTVTTFAVIAGVAGAGLSMSIIIVLGIANLLADGFSMAVSNFLGTRSDLQLRQKVYEMEKTHIEVVPEGEKEEVREIFREKGFDGELLERNVEVITSDYERWIEFMLTEEYGYSNSVISPFKAGLITFLSFIAVGSIPLMAFLYQFLNQGSAFNTFFVSAVMTGLTFFLIGAFKSRFVIQHWFFSGMETFFLGGGAAALAYGVGYFLREMVIK